MYPPDGGGGDPSAALQKQRTQRPMRPMGGQLGGGPLGGPMGGRPMMAGARPRPQMGQRMPGMGAPQGGLGGDPRARMEMMRNQNRPPDLGAGGQMASSLGLQPMAVPEQMQQNLDAARAQGGPMSGMGAPDIAAQRAAYMQKNQVGMQQKMAAAQAARQAPGFQFGSVYGG